MQSALDLAVPVTGIAEAVFARGLSGQAELRAEAQKQDFEGPSGVVPMAEEDKVAFINDIREALYASKIVAYAQGFNEITEAAKVYDWKIDLAAVARIWRGGCIIRAKFLNRISDAFENGEATCLCCSPRTSRTRSRPPSARGDAWSPVRLHSASRCRCSPPRWSTSTACAPRACPPP